MGGDVLAAVRGEEALAVPAEEALQSIEIIERCYRQRRLMAMPWLDADEVAAARRMTAACEDSIES
jgi:hypothetical protein